MSLRRGIGSRIANALSYIINPLILPPIGFGIILYHFGAPAAEVVHVSLVALVFFSLLPLWYLLRMVRRGGAESIEVRRRADRVRPFLVGIAFYLIGLFFLVMVGRTALPLLVALALLYPLNTLLTLLINLRWKISVHMIGLAGFVSVLLFCSLLISDALPAREASLLRLGTVLPLLVLIPILMWARVRVEAHDVGQVVGGTLFGLILPYVQLEIILRLFGYI